jgi:Transposase IS66 family
MAAHGLGLRWARAKGHPTHALCQRVLRHEGELFELVRQAGVEAPNNRAEQAIRPVAVARKITGGTRSGAGIRQDGHQGSITRRGIDTL